MNIKLPKTKSKIKTELYQYTWLVYGHPKVGKTTFCSNFNNPLFVATEDRHKGISVFKMPEVGAVNSWEELKEIFNSIAKEIKNNTFDFSTIVIDTIDNAYLYCREYVNKKQNIEHESDAGYGKGYQAVRQEFWKIFSTLTSLGVAVIFISHSKQEVMNDKVVEYHRIVPSLARQGRDVLYPLLDIVAYIGFNPDSQKRDERLLYLQGSETLEAGCATSQKMPATMPLDYKLIEKEFKKENFNVARKN